MGRTLAVSDIHGDWNIWTAIKNFLQPDDTLYILGDCADRGERGWDIIKEALAHPQVIYLKGNHEDMLVNAVCNSKRNGMMNADSQLLFSNGGRTTLYDWAADTEENQALIDDIAKLPLYEIYMNENRQMIILTHAGLTPWESVSNYSEEELLWDRLHYTLPSWPNNAGHMIVVHGHTPCMYIADDLNLEYEVDQPLWYHTNKCCIDNCTVLNKAAIILDLDTFEYHLIK
jgi:serine/threonine protein phosphatase 1